MSLPVYTETYTPAIPISTPFDQIRTQYGEATSVTLSIPGGWGLTYLGRGMQFLSFPGMYSPGISGPGGSSYKIHQISSYNPGPVQQIVDKVNSWMIENQNFLDFYSCTVIPQAVNDITDLATYGPNIPPADNSEGGGGPGAMWVNTQINQTNGGYSMSNPPTGAVRGNAAGAAADWIQNAGPCYARQ